jgi:hypothetical protein
MFPIALIVPATLIPLPVTTNILALPATPKLILPAVVGIPILLVPLANKPTNHQHCILLDCMLMAIGIN